MVLKLDNKEKQDILTAFDLIKDCKNIELSESVKKRITSLYKKIQKSMKQIKPRSAKNRGLNFQKKVAQFIGELIGIEATQSDDSLIQSRLSGQNGTDIILHGEAKEKFKYSVECKDCNSISLSSWIAQAKQNEEENRPWLLFIHSQLLEDKDIVVMKSDCFKSLFTGEK